MGCVNLIKFTVLRFSREKKILSITSWVPEDAQMSDFRKPLNEAVIINSSHLGLLSCPGSESCMPVVGKVCPRYLRHVLKKELQICS